MNQHICRTAMAVALSLWAAAAMGQSKPETITVPLSRPGDPVSLEIDLISARIEVIGEDRKDAQFAITMGSGERKIKTPSGVRSLTGGGGSFSVDERDNKIEIDSDSHMTKVTIIARVPRRTDLDLSTVNDGEIIVRDITGTLELENANGPITATNISGSVIAETLNDNISITFAGVNTSGATALTSLNGDITVALPPNVGAEFRIDSAEGEIESDYELDVKASKPTVERSEGRRGASVRVEDVVVATVNGGGPVIKMKTLNGNVRIGRPK